MPTLTHQDVAALPHGFCCAECGKELRVGDHYHEVPRECRPADEVEAWCDACAEPAWIGGGR